MRRCLALLAALLVFAYATLSVRRLFQGEYIGALARHSARSRPMPIRRCGWRWAWRCWSAGCLLKSQVLRIASAALIVIAVAKVFIFDMSELEGVLRALSFIGLGAVLIGIGLFYQRMLTGRSARRR